MPQSNKIKIVGIVVALALAFFGHNAFAAYTVVNHCSYGNSSTVTSSSCTLGTVTTGDLIILVDHINTSGITATGTDSGGNTYINATQHLGSGSGRQVLFYAANVTGGSGFVVSSTYSGAGTNFSSISVYEISGVAKTNPLDAATSTITSSLGAGQYSAGSSTLSVAGDYGFAAASTNLVAGPGFTTVGTSTETIEEATTTVSTGLFSMLFTATSTGSAAIANQAFFEPASAAASGPTPYNQIITTDW